MVRILTAFCFFLSSFGSCQSTFENLPLSECQKTPGLPGPEDFAIYSQGKETKLIVSSHNRRDMQSLGNLFEVPVLNNGKLGNPKSILTSLPPHFRPHGISLAKRNGVPTLYVISHTLQEDFPHTIEVFQVEASGAWKHIQTWKDSSLTSPNDLFANDAGEVFISNDRGTGGSLRANWDILTKNPRADLVYSNGKEFFPMSLPVVLGNGIFVRKEEDKEILYRSVFWEEAIHVYLIKRSSTGFPSFHLQKKIYFGAGPDNIMEDEKGDLWVALHPSAYLFTRHAMSPSNLAPTRVVRFSNRNSDPSDEYRNDGSEISAGSTGVALKGRLIVSQVFEDFLINCPYPK